MSVNSSHLQEYDELALGQRIRKERQRQGLTLKQLADRLRISTAKVSQMETGKHVLELRQVAAMADALGRPLLTLLPSDEVIPYQLTQDTTMRLLPRHTASFARTPSGSCEKHHNLFWPLADRFIGRHMEPVRGCIMPLSDEQLDFCYHEEQEFIFVLRGTVEFLIRTPQGVLREVLRRGDCMLFRSDFLHCFRSLEAEPAESIHVYASPSAPMNIGRDWLVLDTMSCVKNGDNHDDLKHFTGQKISIIRQAYGWTLEDVARKVGLTERRLEQIERGDRSIPIDAMFRLAREFGRSLRAFIRTVPESGSYYFLQRSADIPGLPTKIRRRRLERTGASIPPLTYRSLASGFPAHGMFPYLMGIPNVDINDLTFHEHHGQELIYVLDGRVEFSTFAGDRQVHETLHPGDSCYIDSSIPHLVRGESRNPYSDTSAEIICVFWCPLGESYLFED